MKLKKYDGMFVRIEEITGLQFDGVCTYSSRDWCRREYGRDEECLQIRNFLFFSSCIRKVQSLEDYSGPYGRYPDPFGSVETLTVEDGIGTVRDVLFDEEEEETEVIRLLRCLEDYLGTDNKPLPFKRAELMDTLRELMIKDPRETVRRAAAEMLEKWDPKPAGAR